MLQNAALGNGHNDYFHFTNKNLGLEEGRKLARAYPGINSARFMPDPKPALAAKCALILTYFYKD